LWIRLTVFDGACGSLKIAVNLEDTIWNDSSCAQTTAHSEL
jgi:hypothetical protein